MRTATPFLGAIVIALTSNVHAQTYSGSPTSGSPTTAPSAAQAPKKNPINRPDPLVLVDAAGKLVGTYLPVTGSVIVNVQNALIVAEVTNQFDVNIPFPSQGEQSGSTFRWTVRGQTWFLSNDCSGPPIPLAGSGLRPVAYLQDRNTGVLTAYIGGSGRSTAKRANSVRQQVLGGGPVSGACVQESPFGGSIQGFDVESVVNLSQRYPEMLTVQ